MIVATNLPPGFSTEEDEHFVYLVHAGERVSRFSSAGATPSRIECEAWGQYGGLRTLLRSAEYEEPEKCLYDHLHDLFDEAGLSSERWMYWDALIQDAAAREFGECTEVLEEYAAESFAELLADEETWLGFTDCENDPHPERRRG